MQPKARFTQDAEADLRANPLMLLATCVNTPICCSVFHNLHVCVARCSASCVNGAQVGLLKPKYVGLGYELWSDKNPASARDILWYGGIMAAKISAHPPCGARLLIFVCANLTLYPGSPPEGGIPMGTEGTCSPNSVSPGRIHAGLAKFTLFYTQS